jgi:hypothetical protein
VCWNVHPLQVGDNRVASLLGSEWGAQVGYSLNHHGVDDHLGPGRELRGVVRTIRVVTCGLEQQPDFCPHPYPHRNPNRMVWAAVPGSGGLWETQVADPWEPEPPVDEPRGGDVSPETEPAIRAPLRRPPVHPSRGVVQWRRGSLGIQSVAGRLPSR